MRFLQASGFRTSIYLGATARGTGADCPQTWVYATDDRNRNNFGRSGMISRVRGSTRSAAWSIASFYLRDLQLGLLTQPLV